MFKLVFLLVFFAATAIGSREVMLDIYSEREPATGRYNLVCDTPNKTQQVLEGDEIKFNIQTRSHLHDFWCNAYGKTICTLGNMEKTKDDGNIQTWKLSGDYSNYEKATMDGTWTCIYRIKNPHRVEYNAPIISTNSVDVVEGNCQLQFQITEPNISLSISQLNDWVWINQKQGLKRYDDIFTEGEKIFNCVLDNHTDREENYTISFKLDDVQQKRKAKVVIKPRDKLILRDTFKLNSTSSLIICSATNVKGEGPNLHNEIHLQYTPGGGAEGLCWCLPWRQGPTSQVPSPGMQPPKSASGVELHMDGLPPDSCNATDSYKRDQTCTYTFGDPSRLGTTLPLKCVMNGTLNRKAEYKIQFETNSGTVSFERGHYNTKTVSNETLLKEGNNKVKCTANKITKDTPVKMTIEVNIIYIPPTTTTEVTEPSTMPIKPITNQAPTSPESSDAASQSSTGDDEETGAGAWIKWALIGAGLIITICVVVRCIVMYRQKKPLPAESTYANLGKDLNTYQTMPVAAPRTIPKPNGTHQAGAAKKLKTTIENNYSEPKDSQDMSEALYADPQRFNGDSDTYAEPYKPNYAEPYASISEGNYAEVSLPEGSKELYARPIPKAQRKPMVKDETNYSNVFAAQYANAAK